MSIYFDRMVATLALAFYAILCVEANAQNTIEFTVKNDHNQPVQSTIKIKNREVWDFFAETGIDGRFSQPFVCDRNHRFMAEPFDSSFYRSKPTECSNLIEIVVITKPSSTHAGNLKNLNPNVGGAPMFASMNIVENAVKSKDHTTLVAAVKAAGLVETLMSAGPFTVFAPTNAAFAKLPAGTVETLVKPENKDTLTAILTYHVVAGKMTAADIAKAIKAGGGKASLTTINGGSLTATMVGKRLVLTDAKGGKSTVTIADVMQSNGVIHVVDTVALP